jgi:hypothetical protein
MRTPNDTSIERIGHMPYSQEISSSYLSPCAVSVSSTSVSRPTDCVRSKPLIHIVSDSCTPTDNGALIVFQSDQPSLGS